VYTREDYHQINRDPKLFGQDSYEEGDGGQQMFELKERKHRERHALGKGFDDEDGYEDVEDLNLQPRHVGKQYNTNNQVQGVPDINMGQGGGGIGQQNRFINVNNPNQRNPPQYNQGYGYNEAYDDGYYRDDTNENDGLNNQNERGPPQYNQRDRVVNNRRDPPRYNRRGGYRGYNDQDEGGVDSHFRPVVNDNSGPIAIPFQEGRAFEIRPNYLTILPKFTGNATEEPYFHLDEFQAVL